MSRTRTYYQPIAYADDGTNIEYGKIPEKLYSFQAFASIEKCKKWLENNGYDPKDYSIIEYHDDDIEEVMIIDSYGDVVEINGEDEELSTCNHTRLIFKTSAGTFGEVSVASEKITPGNGQSVMAAVMGKTVNAYVMIDRQESYVDLCLSPEESESEDVYDHCPIVAVLSDGYDQTFVERFHPDYNCDKIAWLDDLCCALDNETDNGSHWRTLICEVDIPDKEVYEKCESVADWISDGCPSDGLWDNATLENLGRNIANDYKEAIQRRISEYECEIMSEAVLHFLEKYIGKC